MIIYNMQKNKRLHEHVISLNQQQSLLIFTTVTYYNSDLQSYKAQLIDRINHI